MKNSNLNYITLSALTIILLVSVLSCNPNNNSIYTTNQFTVYPNRIEQNTFTATAINNNKISSNYRGENVWELKRSLLKYPNYYSNYTILNAIYNLSLEEIDRNILSDSIFAIKNLHTHSMSYSTILSLSILCPEICKNSLIKRVANDKIIQENGIGGSWPISSDRIIWAIAAWEIYKTTGDNDWLRKIYFIIKNTIDDDLNVTWNYHEHLFRGSSLLIDDQINYYPKWMAPTDIYDTYSLSNQVLHFQALQALIKMGKLLNKDTQKYIHISNALKESINKKFKHQNSYYANFKYKWPILCTNQSNALGEAMATIWDINSSKTHFTEHLPITEFGVPNHLPLFTDSTKTNSQTLWPFVQSYWNWAASTTKNTKAVNWGIANSIRPTAQFLTNKQSYTLENGNCTENNQKTTTDLLSAAATASNTLHVLFGINITEDYLEFNPVIPRELKGKHVLNNLKYRNSTLDIKILGFGTKISSFTFDSTPYKRAIVPKNIEGYHKIVIKMNNQIPPDEKLNFVDIQTCPETPDISYIDKQLKWNNIQNAKYYKVYQNGKLFVQTNDNFITDINIDEPTEYNVQAIDSFNHYSFLSKTVRLYKSKYEKYLEAELFQPKQKNKFAELKKSDENAFTFTVIATQNARYEIDFLYVNNYSGENNLKCSSRSLWLNNGYLGTLIFPIYKKENSAENSYSNSFETDLKKGYNYFKISFENFNNNASANEDVVKIDKIRILRKN